MLEHTPHSTPPRPKDSRPRRSLPLGTPGRREIALFAAIYLLYDSARWIFVAHLPEARRHANWVIHLERQLHIALEARVQHLLAGGADGMLLSNIYLAAQLVVLPGTLIWLYRRDREIYRRLRNTVVGTWLISTPVFALYPVAPPRLAGIGISDTVSHQAGVGLTGHSTMFYNPYAAVPSLHAGLALAIGIALAAAARPRWARGGRPDLLTLLYLPAWSMPSAPASSAELANRGVQVREARRHQCRGPIFPMTSQLARSKCSS